MCVSLLTLFLFSLPLARRYLTPVKGAGVASVGAEGSGAEGDTVAMQLAKIVPVVNGQVSLSIIDGDGEDSDMLFL